MAQLIAKHRIKIVIRNIGQELPGMAQGILSIDFGSSEAFEEALKTLNDAFAPAHLPHIVTLKNDRREMLGFNPHHYSYHTVPVEDLGKWKPVGCVSEIPPLPSRRRKRGE